MEEGIFSSRVRLADHTYRSFCRTAGMDRNRRSLRLYLARDKSELMRQLFLGHILRPRHFPSPWARSEGTSREKNESKLLLAGLGRSYHFDNAWAGHYCGSVKSHLGYLQPFDS